MNCVAACVFAYNPANAAAVAAGCGGFPASFTCGSSSGNTGNTGGTSPSGSSTSGAGVLEVSIGLVALILAAIMD